MDLLNAPTDLPLVSVIVPCYNTEKYIAEALDSILSQTYPHWEIIAIDDESTDGSAAILDHYHQQHPDRIHVIHQKNQGVARSRMNGIAEANGEFLVTLDADDRLHPDAIETWMNYQRTHSNYKLVFGPVNTIDQDGHLTGIQDFSMSRIGEPFEGVILSTLLVGNVVPSCVLIHRASLLASGGYYSEALADYANRHKPDDKPLNEYLHTEDYFAYLQMALSGYAFGYIPRPLVDYRDVPNSRSKVPAKVYNSQIMFLKYLTLKYSEKMAEAWFIGRNTRETHVGQTWIDMQQDSKTREALLAEYDHKLQETIQRSQERESLLADFEQRLRLAVERSQERESLLADFERQVRAAAEHGQERESLLADFERQVRAAAEHGQERESLLADFERQLREMIERSRERESLLADFERQLREMIERSQERESLLADFERQLREMIEQSAEREKSFVSLQRELQASNEQLQAALKRRFVLNLFRSD